MYVEPQKQLLRSLKENGFRLERQDKHLVYRRDDGRIFVTPATPSDVRWVKNAMATLKRVLAEPPRSEFLSKLDVDKQEAAIRLERAEKAKTAASGAHRKSEGTGFTYINKEVPVLTAEQFEQSRRASAKAQTIALANKTVRRLRSDFIAYVIRSTERSVPEACRQQFTQAHYETVLQEAMAEGISDDMPSYNDALADNITANLSHFKQEWIPIAKKIAAVFDYVLSDEAMVRYRVSMRQYEQSDALTEAERVVVTMYTNWLEYQTHGDAGMLQAVAATASIANANAE